MSHPTTETVMVQINYCVNCKHRKQYHKLEGSKVTNDLKNVSSRERS